MDFLTDRFLVDPAAFDAPVLVTGAGGCIGAWTLAILHRSGVPCIAADLVEDRRRPALLLGDEQAARLDWQSLDVTDATAVEALVAAKRVRAVIHLAGLQVPFCKADPARGARVNVEGTVNILQAARQADIKRTVYASSVAALGIPAGGPYLATLYGAYKAANEHTGQVYWQDWQVPSVGIRPNVVYGLARDQGMSAKGTVAIHAAVAGQPYEIPFSGDASWLYAGEAAAAFVAAIARDGDGAVVFNLNGACADVATVISLIKERQPDADITCTGGPFPFPADLSDDPIRAHLGDYPMVTVADGVAATHQAFTQLHKENRLPELPS